MNKESLPKFSGKCISMSLIDSTHSHDLNDPHFEYQGGKLYIVGTIPVGATDSGWDANQIGAVSWEQVRNYILFENLEAYTKAIEISEKYQTEDEQKNT
jgi:hypothetical protein